MAKEEPVPLGQQVVVIGGGNAAIDSARTAAAHGRRRSRSSTAASARTCRPSARRWRPPKHEGAHFVFLATPHRIVGDADGAVKAIEVVKTRLGEFDSSGRRRPVPTEEIQRFECDTVILAVGEAVDLDFVPRLRPAASRRTARWRWTATRWRPAASKFYAGGDLITGASNVSNAMGYGKKAARNIDQRLMGEARVQELFCRSSSTTRRRPRSPARAAATTLPSRARRASACETFEEAIVGADRRGSAWKKPAAACAATSGSGAVS